MKDDILDNGDVVTHTIKVDGKAVSGCLEFLSINVKQALNRITTAEIVVLDGSAAKGTFAVSCSNVFVPGNSILIEAGYNNQNKRIFAGMIIKQSIEREDDGGSRLTIECKDKAVKLTIGRKSGQYTNMSDSSIMKKLIVAHPQLKAKVTATTKTYAQMVRSYCSDWDFMLARAEVNGMLVTTIANKVSIFRPEAADRSTPVLAVVYGDNLYNFNAQLNTVTQFSTVKASAWDFKTQKLISSQANQCATEPGNISSKDLAKVIGLSEYQLQTSASLDKEDLEIWAKAQKLKSDYGKITGEVRIQGASAIESGKYITLSGVGERFNGKHLVSSVVHNIADGNWFVTAELGLSADWFVQEPDVMAPAASGLLPGAQGLHCGKVLQIDADPIDGYRIRVHLPLLGDKKQGIWSRLSNFYSTKGAGAFFMPEIDDEVIVGFLNEDPRFPVILGSLYSQGIKPHSSLKANNKNSHKAIVSKSELRIVFDDENKVLSLTTPNGNQVEFDDKNKKIKLADQHKNSVSLSSSGIELKSDGDIKIMAGKKVVLKGSKGVVANAPRGDVISEGLNIKATATKSFTAKGNGSATVKGGGKLTLKAGLITIN